MLDSASGARQIPRNRRSIDRLSLEKIQLINFKRLRPWLTVRNFVHSSAFFRKSSGQLIIIWSLRHGHVTSVQRWWTSMTTIWFIRIYVQKTANTPNTLNMVRAFDECVITRSLSYEDFFVRNRLWYTLYIHLSARATSCNISRDLSTNDEFFFFFSLFFPKYTTYYMLPLSPP